MFPEGLEADRANYPTHPRFRTDEQVRCGQRARDFAAAVTRAAAPRAVPRPARRSSPVSTDTEARFADVPYEARTAARDRAQLAVLAAREQARRQA